ncbi:MAG: hypothetical protein M1541_06805 [Acidobacteria bacterium]|nr:hypothetical protein [Acidobacteriota bacterium]
MLVVVGGHSRGIGKTSVVAGLIRALPEWNWTAMKITQTGHGICSSAGRPCGCAPAEPDHPFAITPEEEQSPSDTGRFLTAGACRAFWLRTAMGQLGNAVPEIRRIIETGENTIIESNSILQFFKPDIYLAVMDFSKEDFKPSSLRFLDRADALIVMDTGINVPLWKNVSRGLWDKKRQFLAKPPQYCTTEISEFVRGRLSGMPR